MLGTRLAVFTPMPRLQLISMALVASFTAACAVDELAGEPAAPGTVGAVADDTLE